MKEVKNSMQKIIAKWLKIYEDEISLFFWALILLFFIRSACIIFNNFSETAFLKRFGVEYLPIVYVINSITTFIIMAFMTGYMKRLPGARLLFYLLLFCSAVVAAFRFVIPFGFELIYPVLFVLNTQFEVLLILIFWNLGNDLFNTRQSKRIFPLITIGGVIGRILGSFGTPFFVKAFSFDNLMWVYCGFALAGALVARQMGVRFPTLLISDQEPGQVKKRTPMIEEFKMVWPMIQESTLAKIFIFLTLLPNIAIPILNYQFNFAVNDHFASEGGMVQFFGYFRGVINIISLILLLFIGRVYGRWGLPVVMLFHPINYFIVFLSFFLRLNIFTAMYARLSTNIIRTTMNAPATGILMGLFPLSYRNVIRPFLRGTVVRIGVLIGSGLILVLEHSANPRWLSLAGMIVISGWIITTLFLKKSYPQILSDLISRNLIDLKAMKPDDVKQVFNDKAARNRLKDRFLAARGAECLWYARLLQSQGAENLDALILTVLDKHDDTVKAELLGLLSADAGKKAIPILKKMAASANPELQIAIVKTLARMPEPSALKICREIFKTAVHPRGKAYALIPLYTDAPEKYAAVIDAWLQSDDPEKRRAGVIIAGASRDAAYIPKLGKLADKEEIGAILPDLLKAFHQLGLKKINDRIDPYLSHHRTDVRLEALNLYEIHNDTEMEKVVWLLNDPSATVCKAAYNKLKESSYQNPQVLIKAINLPRRKIRESIFKLLQLLNIVDLDVFRYARNEIHRGYICLAESQGIAMLRDSQEKELLFDHLNQKIEVMMENVLRVLASQDNSGKMRIVWRGVFSNDARQRSNSLEALENQTDRSLSEIMIPLLEKLSLEESLETGRQHFDLPVFDGKPAELYTNLLSHADWVTVLLCLGHSVRVGADSAADRIEPEMLKDLIKWDNPHVRHMAQWALDVNHVHPEENMNASISVSDKVLHLKSIQIFKDLAVSELAAIASVTDEVTVEAGEDFIKEGDAGDIMYLVIEGDVAVIKGAEQTGGRGIELARIKTGDYFGEMALFEDAPRAATIRTVDKSWLLALPKDEFAEIVREYPQIALHICKAFGGRIRELHDVIKGYEKQLPT